MYDDPIVEEVRKAGQFLAEQSDKNLHTFLEFLRKAQQDYKDRLVHTVVREAGTTESKRVVETLSHENSMT